MKDQIANNPIYEVNPITDVDRLLNVLLGITNEIIWTGLGIYIIDSKSNIIISIYKNIISIEKHSLHILYISTKRISIKAPVSRTVNFS